MDHAWCVLLLHGLVILFLLVWVYYVEKRVEYIELHLRWIQEHDIIPDRYAGVH